MRYNFFNVPRGTWVYHAEECRAIQHVTEVDDERLTYTVAGEHLVCRNCGMGGHDEVPAKKILVDLRKPIIIINPIEDADDGNTEEKAADDGHVKLELTGIL